MPATPDLTIDNEATPDTRPHNDPENHPRPRRLPADHTPLRFGKRKTVRIIRQLDPDPKPRRQIIPQRLPVQDDRIGIFHRLESGIEYTRRTETDRPRLQPGLLLHFGDKTDDLAENMLIAFHGFRVDPSANNRAGMVDGFQDNAFDLRPSKIDPPKWLAHV
jgi:hypothetical protein